MEVGPFVYRGRDTLLRRLRDVRNLIGGNVDVPLDPEAEPIDIEAEVDVEAFVADMRSSYQDDDILGFVDAFKPIREIVAPDRGLVPARTYEQVKDTQATVRTKVSSVISERCWAFFALGGCDRYAPRWVFLEDCKDPVFDLAEVATKIRKLITEGVATRKYDVAASELVKEFALALHGRQEFLLSPRRRRALEMARRVIGVWLEESQSREDIELEAILADVYAYLWPGAPEEPAPDFASVADAWLAVIQPARQAYIVRQRNKRGRLRLVDLEPILREQPLEASRLQSMFAELELSPPIPARIVSAIVGVPGPFEPHIPLKNNHVRAHRRK